MTYPTPATAGPSAPTVGAAQAGVDVTLYTTSVNCRVAAVTLAALADFATRQGWTVARGLRPRPAARSGLSAQRLAQRRPTPGYGSGGMPGRARRA
jgi:hypothetical protein